MAFPLMLSLCALTVLLVVPFTHATDYLTTYPSFAKCDEKVIKLITSTNVSPSKNVYQNLASQDTWVKAFSSYNYKMSPTKCVTMQCRDGWFNVTAKGSGIGDDTSYQLNYVVKEVDEGLEGHTVPDEPRRSWKMFPILSGKIIQALYFCNTQFEAKDIPLHGDIFVAKSALKNLYDVYSVMKNVKGLGKLMESYTKFTFAATENCLLK